MLIVDAFSVGSRAFYGNPESFFSMTYKVINMTGVKSVMFCFDSVNNWRTKLYPEYKKQRVSDHKRLRLGYLRNIYRALKGAGLPVVTVDGYEADDLIANLATPIDYVMSGDKDLAAVPAKFVYNIDREWRILSKAEIKGLLGVPCQYIRTYKALAGDSSDYIIGVRGIGPVAAKDLISKFGDFESIMLAAKRGQVSTKNQTKLLLKQEEQARIFYKIIGFAEVEVERVEVDKIEKRLERARKLWRKL